MEEVREGLPRVAKGGRRYIRRVLREKELSTKGHEGRRRDTKGLEEVREGLPRVAKEGEDTYEGC